VESAAVDVFVVVAAAVDAVVVAVVVAMVAVVVRGETGAPATPWKNLGGCIGGMGNSRGRKARGWSHTDARLKHVTEALLWNSASWPGKKDTCATSRG